MKLQFNSRTLLSVNFGAHSLGKQYKLKERGRDRERERERERERVCINFAAYNLLTILMKLGKNVERCLIDCRKIIEIDIVMKSS